MRPLKQSQSVLRLLFDTNPFPMWIFDRKTLDFLEINGAAEKKYGYTRAEFMKMKVTEIRPDAEIPRLLKYLSEMEEGVQNQGEWKHRAKNGQSFDMEIVTHAINWGGREAVLTVAHDLTDKKRMQETLEGTEQRLKTVVGNAPIILFALDAPGMITLVDGKALALIGKKPADLAGLSAFEVFKEKPQIVEAIRKALAGENFITDVEWSGHTFETQFTAQPDGNGMVRGVFGVAIDVTEVRQAQEQRLRLLQLEKAARFKAEAASRAKDEFLALVSHELRTPMAAMMGWTWLLRYGSADEATRERAFDIIERNMKLQAQISEDLLDISSIVTGKLKLESSETDIAPILRSVLDVVRTAAEARAIKVELKLDPAGGWVMGDPDRLQQIFWNLMSNAIKFTPEGGRVTLRTKVEDSHVAIAVSDTGQGISQDFLGYVFDPFHQEENTLTRRHRGLGLGLAIVRHLVELHGGTIQVDSAGPGKGATFTVSLPASVPSKPAPKRDGAKAGPKVHHSIGGMLEGVQVLVVDDAEDNCTFVTAILQKAGAKVVAASSAADALQAFSKRRPDVLVSDIMMPEEDGYSLIRKIRAMGADQGGNVPAVALTACARIEDRTLALLAGFQIYVTKPIEPVELTTVVASLAKHQGSDAKKPTPL